jgi:flavoprotein
MGLGPIVIPLDRSRTEAAHLPFRNETVCRATELIWARSPFDPIAALYRKRAPLPVCEKLPPQTSVRASFVLCACRGCDRQPECQGRGDGENLADGRAFSMFMRNLPFCLIDQAAKSSA